MNTKDYIRAWNERVGEQTSHIAYNNTFFKQSEVESFYKSVVDRIDVTNKNIIDYGFGGGLFFEWLVKNYSIKNYIGFDIAKRQYNAMQKKVLENSFKNVKIALINPTKIPSLKELNCDIFFAIELIHHIPDLEYFEYFFKTLNESGVKTFAFTYKKSDSLTFKKNPYKTTNDIAFACLCNNKDISNILTNYKLNINLSDDRVLIYNIKKGKNARIN